MNMKFSVAGLLYIAATALVVIGSGSAGDYSGLKLYGGILLAFVALIHGSILGIRHSLETRSSSLPPFTAITAFSFAVVSFVGLKIDNTAQSMTEAQGEAIVLELRKYVTENDSCPPQFSSASAFGGVLPKPRLRDTEFKYRRYGNDDCGIEFHGTAGFYCSFHLKDDEWFCAD